MELRRRYYLEDKTIALGLCFDYAFKEARKYIDDDSVRIVQGILDPAHGTEGKVFKNTRPYAHGWVERDGMVYDWQTMEQPGGGGKRHGKGWTQNDFYDLFNPIKVKKYKPSEYVSLVIKHRHNEPWNL